MFPIHTRMGLLLLLNGYGFVIYVKEVGRVVVQGIKRKKHKDTHVNNKDETQDEVDKLENMADSMTRNIPMDEESNDMVANKHLMQEQEIIRDTLGREENNN